MIAHDAVADAQPQPRSFPLRLGREKGVEDTLPDGGIAIARGAGATVTGLGVIDWLLRGATGEVLRSLLGGNLVVQILSLLVNASEVLAGHLPAQAASASLLHLILSAMFVFALLRTDRGAKAQPRGSAVAR